MTSRSLDATTEHLDQIFYLISTYHLFFMSPAISFYLLTKGVGKEVWSFQKPQRRLNLRSQRVGWKTGKTPDYHQERLQLDSSPEEAEVCLGSTTSTLSLPKPHSCASWPSGSWTCLEILEIKSWNEPFLEDWRHSNSYTWILLQSPSNPCRRYLINFYFLGVLLLPPKCYKGVEDSCIYIHN